MLKDTQVMTLATRLAQFQALVSACEFTDPATRLSPEEGIAHTMQMLRSSRERGNNVYLVGNGGSAGIASHVTTDFVNVAKLRAHTVHDSSLLTCMANDYGYENAFARILSQLMRAGDVLIAISSSGKSQNIRNAAVAAKQHGGKVLTLTGFDRDNPLRFLGDVNIWIDSCDYGFVEIGHLFILHNLADRFGHEATTART